MLCLYLYTIKRKIQSSIEMYNNKCKILFNEKITNLPLSLDKIRLSYFYLYLLK